MTEKDFMELPVHIRTAARQLAGKPHSPLGVFLTEDENQYLREAITFLETNHEHYESIR